RHAQVQLGEPAGQRDLGLEVGRGCALGRLRPSQHGGRLRDQCGVFVGEIERTTGQEEANANGRRSRARGKKEPARGHRSRHREGLGGEGQSTGPSSRTWSTTWPWTAGSGK